jgi:hypothetical protein
MSIDKLPEEYNYNPMPDGVRSGPSIIADEGLFATKNMPKDKILGTSHYDLHCSEIIYNEQKAQKVMEEFPMLLMRSRMGSYINHSKTPSVEMYTDDFCHYVFKLLRDVVEGEELTIDYTSTPCYDKKCSD